MEGEKFRRICFDDEEVDARATWIRQPSLSAMSQILSRSRESSYRATTLSSFRTATSRSIFNEDDEEESLEVMIERILGKTSSLHTPDNKNNENRSTK